ncbi:MULTISPECIES: ABC transporter substrate-binding protein [unclassified Pseudodesulfovibrio]|uniref:ABC transporter substrate-binding protein n=1 Tax=unclassified Pseudodesulfovibrio TaxID=2661612 RepID=UPI000FEC16E9|nr:MULTISPECIES: ABC transporter substrate-binding protein [unclassified Pseudodesulfovibrio]MCJ2164831.1 ABC transporter substrate-binding protein [Pseudodesulfovibrio sp. S3-i]RWU03800.1 ABC transporter substrate-binding protein [Pseudodesulfovibrio sp. S3]
MRTSNSQISLLGTVALLLLLLPAPASALEPASIILQWLPQAQFAGFFVAKDKGFYEEEGIDLTILSGGPDVLASDYLDTGKADFATLFLSTGLKRRETMPIVNIGQFVQRSALMLITKKSAKINSFKDLDGKKVGLWANEFQIQAIALFRQNDIRVTVVPQSNSLDLFMRGGVQAASGMWYNEYHTLLTYGLDESDLHPLFFNEAGLNFPEDGIYCLEKTATERKELCLKLVRATIRGWQYAFAHTEEALDIVLHRMREAKVSVNRVHQRWMLKRMEDIIMSDENATMGVLRKDDFERVQQVLLNTEFMDTPVDYADFYRGME